MSTHNFSGYARYYDLFYRDKDYAGEARLVDSLVRPAGVKPSTLIDIGCGTGAHVREFSRFGWKVHGVDLAPQMVEIAEQRTPRELGAEFTCGAAGEFSLGRTFSAAVSLFHVVSYQTKSEDVARMFSNVRRHLEPGGLFVFDFWHAPGVLADPPTVRVRRFEQGDVRLTRIAEPSHFFEQSLIEVRYELLIEEIKTARLERVVEVHKMRYFAITELEQFLSQAGFSIKGSWSGMSEAPLQSGSWYGLIVAAAI